MKLSSISVKRRPVKKSAFRTLFANVTRKKHRAATSAAPASELEGDVPNLGIARALIVILIIHVVAIAGIFVHTRWFDGSTATAASTTTKLPEPAASSPQTISKDDKRYMVANGESYATIAAAHGVQEEELRALNDNQELRGGRVLRIPAPSALPPKAIAVVESAGTDPSPAPKTRSAAAAPVDELRNAPMVETANATPQAGVRTTPAATASPSASGKRYMVKNGDTFWRIAQANGTTPDAIMKANQITDPRKLRAGMALLIP